MEVKQRKDYLCGIERWPQSEDYNKLVCPIVVLWQTPILATESKEQRRAVAVAEHGEEVTILDKIVYQGMTFFHVQPVRAEWVGKWRRLRVRILTAWAWVRRQDPPVPSGWVSATFMRRHGRNVYRDARSIQEQGGGLD